MNTNDIEKLTKDELKDILEKLKKNNKEYKTIIDNAEPACNNCKDKIIDLINKKLEKLKIEDRATEFLDTNNSPPSCGLCDLNQTADLEKYLGLMPFSINSDDKYRHHLDEAKQFIINNTIDFKNSKSVRCSPPSNKSIPRNFKMAYVYFDPIDKKYNLNQPGFAIQEKNICNPGLKKTKKKGGKRRKSRKKRRRRKKHTKKRKHKRR
tara:strand:+ start:5304 stop:5927 length:624 start_codon:yes stop_codon:yes gene_type:complete